MHNEHHSSHETPGFGKNTNGLGILIVAAVFIVITLFTWWLWNNNHKEFNWYRVEGATVAHNHDHEEHGASASPLGALDTLTGNYIYELGEEMEITLPDSAKTKMMVGRNSTEAKLYAFLSNDDMVVDTLDKTRGWITCDRIFFETGKAVLAENSIQQIERLATIIKAYPIADVKVGGYTDTTGNAEINTKVSTERANAVAGGMQAKTGKLIASEGYGPLHPIADNATPEGRAMNRRVDIRVIKK